MKTFKHLFYAVCLLTLTAVNAQVTTTTVIKGSPYLDDTFADGAIHYASKVHTAPVRYNIFLDVVEYQQAGKPLALDPNETIKKVRIGEMTLIPMKYEDNGKSKFAYFQLLDSGKVTLYSKKKIIILQPKKGGALDGSDQPAEYKRSGDTFYFKTSDGVLQEIESIKSMIATLPDKQEELTVFAKKEKISPRKEKEVIQFVKYYNSLAEEE